MAAIAEIESQHAASNTINGIAALVAAEEAIKAKLRESSDDCNKCKKWELVYRVNPKHGLKRRMSGGRIVARRPTNGQYGLTLSVPVDPAGKRRLGYDAIHEELTVFPHELDDPNNCIRYYHGWVVEEKIDLKGRQDITNTAIGEGYPLPK